MNEKEARSLADCIESLENLNGALQLPMPAAFHVERFKEALPDLIAEFKAAYSKELGENPWAE